MKKNSFIELVVGFILVLFTISGCSHDDLNTWQLHEKESINGYVKSLGDTAYVLTANGLYYIELTAGTGAMPVAGDTVTFRYKGSFLDGVVFDSNTGTGKVPFKMIIGSGEIIDGLDEGIRLMKKGGKGKFLTPSSLAYGHGGIPNIIPGYTPLLFEITLLTVSPGPGK
jgi:FKBP-type peptidyl-prolyl cis-trans isomerase FkpA